jgi:putative ABC transport system permease protein
VPLSPHLALAVWRHSLRHPVQLALAVLGIALGVAVVVSIDLANASARRAFELSAEGVAGRATHRLVGGTEGLPEALYVDLRVGLGVRASAPVVEGYVSALDHPGRTFLLLGVDPFAERGFRPYLGEGERVGGEHLPALLTRPGGVLVSTPVAAELGLGPGASLRLRVGGREQAVILAGTVEPRGDLARQTLDGVLVADIATAQELLGLEGRLSRIDLALGGAGEEALLARVRARLPPGVEVEAVGSRGPVLDQMTRAFRLNLTMLSLLALVVGVFLVYNTMAFSVIQRRTLLGTLRALGVSRSEVFAVVLGEALLVGAAGTLLGLGLGVWLADGFLALITRTINDLYFVLSVREVALAPGSLAKGLALGLLASAAAAAVPAAEATRVAPRATLSRSSLEGRAARLAPRAAVAGVVVLAASLAPLAVPGRALAPGFLALFGVIVGFALLVPEVAVLLVAPLPALLRRVGGVQGPLAARGVRAALSRTAVAIAALTVAVAATVGVGVMVDSFRKSVAAWLEQTLRADLYVSVPSAGGVRGPATLDPGVVERLTAGPGVEASSTVRHREVASSLGEIRLTVFQLVAASYPGFRLLVGTPGEVWPAFEGREGVLISESFAFRHGIGRGGSVELRTDRGPRSFPVVGVYRDYGSDRGVVAMSRQTYARHWDDPGVTGVGLYLAAGADPAAVLGAVRARAGPGSAVLAQSNRDLREASLAVFDRTFAITLALRALTTLVAFVGVLSALMALELERGREVAVLRAVGLTRGQVWGLVVAQTGLMGLLAGLLALPLGLTLALILIHVVNRRSFGWSLDVAIDPALLAQGLALAVAAALLAGIYPAWRMARTSPARALREE